MSEIAHAALPVVVALLILAVAARVVLWTQVDDDLTRFAREHLEALSSWCLIGLVVYGLALAAAGELSVLSFIVAVVMGVVAVLARNVPEEKPAPESAPPDMVVEPPPARPVAPTTGSLWARQR
jgi:Na+-transporting methylmalonyl-CoA/oxaloacetate decarboxylase gamma subunit